MAINQHFMQAAECWQNVQSYTRRKLPAQSSGIHADNRKW